MVHFYKYRSDQLSIEAAQKLSEMDQIITAGRDRIARHFKHTPNRDKHINGMTRDVCSIMDRTAEIFSQVGYAHALRDIMSMLLVQAFVGADPVAVAEALMEEAAAAEHTADAGDVSFTTRKVLLSD
ncbi:hypothetical protein HDV00_000946 [Rhizophlyctis rosea]|nr:hypothetical protein HDV00_000946 [Rhizophlyctis rosea]